MLVCGVSPNRADGESAMIKVRVDWHHKCPGCGTEIVTDYFDDSPHCRGCPWCGCAGDHDPAVDSCELRSYVLEAVREIEERANGVRLTSS